MEKPIIYPAPLQTKHVGAPVSMALMEIDELLLKIFKDYGIMIRNFNPMIGMERLCDPSTLSRQALSDIRFALDRYIPDKRMVDPSMKSIFVEAIGAFFLYEKAYFIYKDCFVYGFQNVLDRAEHFRKEEALGKKIPRIFLRIENFKKILTIAETNKEKYPKILKLKEVATSYLFSYVKKVIFANTGTAPYVCEMLNKWGLKTEIVKGGKGVKRIERLKSGDLKCLVFTGEPMVKMEINRMMIIHYLLPSDKENMNVKNECNGTIAPEIAFYIYMEHFIDRRKLKMTQNRPKSPKKKKGQGTLDLWG